MKFLCEGDWGSCTSLGEIGGRFLNDGDLVPSEGMALVGRWHDVSAKMFWLVVEVSDLAAFQGWAAKWSDYIDFTVYPVLDDEECAGVLSEVLGQG